MWGKHQRTADAPIGRQGEPGVRILVTPEQVREATERAAEQERRIREQVWMRLNHYQVRSADFSHRRSRSPSRWPGGVGGGNKTDSVPALSVREPLYLGSERPSTGLVVVLRPSTPQRLKAPKTTLGTRPLLSANDNGGITD